MIKISLGIVSSLGISSGAHAQTISPNLLPETEPTNPQTLPIADPLMQSVPSVQIFSDVTPDDWAYEYVKTLNERYNLKIGDADGKFRGNEPLTRYEFASVLAQVLKRVEIFRDQEQEELNALQRLLNSYRDALTSLRIRMRGLPRQDGRAELNGLEERSDRLVKQNVSPTTKLQTQIVQSLTDGTGANTTTLSRIRLNLRSSFRGTDQLVTQLEFGNNGRDAIAKAQEEQGNALGSVGAIADGGGLIETGTATQGRIRKLYYEFPVSQAVRVAIGSNLPPSDFVDRNRFANSSGRNFASSFFANNPLIVQNEIDQLGGAGVAADWKITPQISLRGIYAAADADRPQSNNVVTNIAAAQGVSAPLPQTTGGLFGDRYQATIEAEYQPRKDVAVRLQYTNAQINGMDINAVGLNAEWAIRREIAVFGRLGFGRYAGFNLRRFEDLDLNPRSWMVGATLRNFLITGSKAGIAIGQPFVESDFGNATQTNTEAYFSFLINDKINLIPSLQIVSNPDNRRGKTIWQWAFRVVVDF
ncbi:iron uptake porin [filamentous cyanobacterium LEGE 11480]|uniref:Iron uptake porin n=1 Tax=Romeriopsis navalis LEGE 11480 TaxID=2777977 RepID=A0A928VVI0_9CYAN|nr:iron uptake porin [Romeriopsis navalis]MBE9033262.1 iron uptake porin [Romeriopsis navalis LEGE 11480]